MREVHYLNKDINRTGKTSNLNNYKNRPMVNLSRPEFDLNSRNYIALSPIVKRKNYFIAGDVLKNYKEKKPYNFMNHNNYLLASKQNDAYSAEQFLRGKIKINFVELQPNKFKQSFLEKFSPIRRKSSFF
jgi:hypothetical protein